MCHTNFRYIFEGQFQLSFKIDYPVNHKFKFYDWQLSSELPHSIMVRPRISFKVEKPAGACLRIITCGSHDFTTGKPRWICPTCATFPLGGIKKW